MSTLTMKGDQAIAFTAIANNQFISGGALVKAMSATQVATDWSNLEVDHCDAAADNAACVGIALTNAASGEKLSFAMEGFYTITADGGVEAGDYLMTGLGGDGDTVRAAAQGAAGSSLFGVGSRFIGIALAPAASGERTAVALRL